jgi:hypothetical protein
MEEVWRRYGGGMEEVWRRRSHLVPGMHAVAVDGAVVEIVGGVDFLIAGGELGAGQLVGVAQP